MSRLQGPLKENFDARIRSSLELMKRGELGECFSILSKQLYAVAILEIDNPHDLDEDSILYHYELVFRLVEKFRMYESFEFVMHFIAVDLYFQGLGHKDADIMFHEDLTRFNSLLLSYVKMVTTGAYDRVIRFDVSGYEFNNRLYLPDVYNLIYELYSVKFEISKNNYVIEEQYEESMKDILAFKTLNELYENAEGVITESILDDVRNTNNKLNVEKIIRKYKNQIQGSGKTNAIKNVTGRIEDFIHNFVYQYFIQEFNSSYVFSELATTNFRYDLFISSRDELSVVIELKVFRDGSCSVNEAIEQTIGYLENGKAEVLKRPLDYGVVLAFNATGKELTASKYDITKSHDMFYIDQNNRVIICEIKM
ncbi:hypothetical protein AN1V17_08210 [Vallitalea sediminicola]